MTFPVILCEAERDWQTENGRSLRDGLLAYGLNRLRRFRRAASLARWL